MALSIFVITQIALDITIVVVLFTSARRRRASAARRARAGSAPPSWYGDFLATAEELMVLVEPVLDLAERGGLPAAPAASPPGLAAEPRPARTLGDRHRAARALLRAGTSADEVARREGLLPGEMRLIANLVAAEAELAGARGR